MLLYWRFEVIEFKGIPLPRLTFIDPTVGIELPMKRRFITHSDLVVSLSVSNSLKRSFSWLIGKNVESDLISLFETLKNTTESQWVMILLIYGLRSGTGLQDR